MKRKRLLRYAGKWISIYPLLYNWCYAFEHAKKNAGTSAEHFAKLCQQLADAFAEITK